MANWVLTSNECDLKQMNLMTELIDNLWTGSFITQDPYFTWDIYLQYSELKDP